MKKAMALLLVGFLSFALAACRGNFIPTSSSLGGVSSGTSTPVQSNKLPEQNLNINMLTGTLRPESMQEGQRPVAIMVANNQRALPQRGVAAADVVYEMVTEGGITRLMALYADYSTVPQVGPVRSTRDQFLQFTLPSASIPVHIGTSIYARNLLAFLEYKAVDGIQLGTTSFYYDASRAGPKPQGKLNEYCWYTDAGLIWSGMVQLDVLTTGDVQPLFWFTDVVASKSEAAHTITVDFSAEAGASFVYDEATGLYNKNSVYKTPELSEMPHADEDGARLAFTNVIMLDAPIGLKPDGQCTDFNLESGTGFYFTAGGVQQITWQKGDPIEPLRLFAEDGSVLPMQRGKSYIGVVSADGADSVTFLPKQAAAMSESVAEV